MLAARAGAARRDGRQGDPRVPQLQPGEPGHPRDQQGQAHARPRHAVARPGPRPDDSEIQEEIRRKDDKLLALLKEVYVDSRDPPVQVKDEGGIIPSNQQECRLTKLGHLSDLDIPSIPKGKISVVEVLTLLNDHKLSPQTWTAEKIAKEYSIDLKEVTSLLEFFIPFAVEIFPPKDKNVL